MLRYIVDERYKIKNRYLKANMIDVIVYIQLLKIRLDFKH